jgi:hypothetical protein
MDADRLTNAAAAAVQHHDAQRSHLETHLWSAIVDLHRAVDPEVDAGYREAADALDYVRAVARTN